MTRRILAALLLLAVAAPARADLLDDIMKSGRIRIATDTAIPPAGMVDDKMQPIGSDVETAKLLAADWGLKLEWVATTGPTRIPNLLTGKADVVISTLSVTPERAKVIDFSRAYTVLQSVIGGPAGMEVPNLEALRGKTVAVTRGTTQDTRMTGLAAAHGITVQRYDDDATLVTAAATGQARLIATSVALVDAVGQKVPEQKYAPRFVLDNFDIAVGVRKGEPRMVEKLNAWVLANLQNGKLNEAYKTFYKADLPEGMRPPLVK